MKILILRFSSIGDIVLTSPVVRCLKQQLPNVEIHFATKNKFKSLLEHNPYIDKIHVLNDSIFDLIGELQTEKFDVIIDLHNNLRTRIIKTFVGKKSYSFSKLNFEKWLMVNFKINRLPNVHIVDRYLAATKKLGIKNDGKGLDFFISKEDDDFGLNFSTSNSSYIAFAIGGQFATKKLPKEKMVELIHQQNKKVVLLGGKEDELVANFILSNTKNTESFCGKISLHQSAAIIKYADLVLTHDTGLMHIAAAYQKKINIFWGNTIPQFGMYPYLHNTSDFKNFEVQNLSCRPCSKIGYAECPKQHFNCMNQIHLSTLFSK
ncbi:MAG: hypothetical protein RI955_478 [Bacteroidota bacterium]